MRMQRLAFLCGIGAVGVMVPAPATGQVADLVLMGGQIWTGADDHMATAVAVSGGRVLAVGSDEEIERLAGPATEHIVLDGRRVLPGFMDAHTHFIDGGFELASVELRDAASPEEFARRIGEFAAAHSGAWVTGGTWDHELWGGELPRKEWIDSLTRDTPVFVSRLDGHMGLANSVALARAGITAATPDPPGGTIVRADNGDPTGVLKDAAQSLVSRVIPARSRAEVDRALEAAVAHAVAHGVTMITDMGSWAGHEAYMRAAERRALPIRVYSVVPIALRARLAAEVERVGRGDHRLFWGGVKAFVDGSLGSTTAWFYEPYVDEPSTTGLTVSDTSELREAMREADAAGLQLIVHAIGDRANDWLLEAFADVRASNGPRDRRPRIEHAQHLTRQAIQRIADDGVIASMQPYHAIDDGRWAEKRIGQARLETTYAFRDLEEARARVAFGSDWTVAPLDPLRGIYAAVTRRTIDGANPDGWVPRQRVSVADAVRSYTSHSAYAAYLEGELGTLEPGKHADLVVLSDDIFAIDPVKIEHVKVDLTMVSGEVVYERK
ncbi:MAG: amidohydrolase [Gemmatimonadota bacterium]|nr:amidohydrolase [Gemmatimonadota bacterium]